MKNRRWPYITIQKTIRKKATKTKKAFGCICIFLQACATQAPGPVTSSHTAPPSINTSIAQAQFYAQKQQFSLAEHTIAQALSHQPSNSQLLAAHKTYQQLSAKEIDLLALEALIKRADWLKSAVRVKETQAINSPTTLKTWQIQQLKNEQAELNQQLLDCAEKHLSKPTSERWSSRCLNAIDQPLLSTRHLQKFVVLNKALKEKQQKIQIAAALPAASTASDKTFESPRNTETKLNTDLQNLESALKDKDYQRAQSLTKRLQKTAVNSEQARALLKRSNEEIGQYAKRLASQADTLYLQEKVAEADALWLELLTLYPNHDEYRQNHERAEKILKNIQSIKQDSLEKNP